MVDVFTLDSFHLISVYSWSIVIKQQPVYNLREKLNNGETFLFFAFVYRYRWWAVPNVQEDDESYASFTLVEKFLSHFPLMRGANSSKLCCEHLLWI